MPSRRKGPRTELSRAGRKSIVRAPALRFTLPAGADEASLAATSRLSLYLRALIRCDAEGTSLISSDGLAAATGSNPSLVRKDLAHFGQFGIRGVGYEVPLLRTRITKILGLEKDLKVVIIGAGNLGMALADYRGFNSAGVRTIALFDTDPGKLRARSRGGVPVRSMKDLAMVVRREGVDVAVLAVPSTAAQKVFDQVAAAGVRAVLNFVPLRLKTRRGVHVRSVDLKAHLEGLAYMLARSAPMRKAGPRVRAG